MAAKIIVTGSVSGQLKPFFEKIRKLNAKTPFSFLVIAGDLFAPPGSASVDDSDDDDDDAVGSLLNGKLEVPLPTYFGLGHYALPPRVIERIEAADGELCPNLNFLGKRSTTKTPDAIRMVALGGLLDPNVTAGLSEDQYLPFHTESDAKALHGANSADLLLTASWPAGIRNGSKAAFPSDQTEPAPESCVADLCAALRPRYHFSASPDLSYEREPFIQPARESSPDERHVTRFISLASFGSPSKAKWLYAFSLDPKASTSTTLPDMTTTTPFQTARKRPLDSQSVSFSRFSGNTGNHRGPSDRKDRKRRKKDALKPSECFFCLSNENVSQHMIASIGDESYLSTARGPLLSSSSFKNENLSFPCHMLIVPFSHSSSLGLVAEKESRTKTFAEMQSYRRALQDMLRHEAGGKVGAVTWEISWQRGVHFHWQVLPVARELVEKGLVEAAFKVQAEMNQWPEMNRREIGDGLGVGEYFRVWIWAPGAGSEDMGGNNIEKGDGEEGEGGAMNGGLDGVGKGKGTEVELVLQLDTEMRFDVQFGRRVMAKLLEIGDRVDWKDCLQSEEDETKDAEAFKKAFEKWDFTLS